MRLKLRKIALYFLILFLLNSLGFVLFNKYMAFVLEEAAGTMRVGVEKVSTGGGYIDVIENLNMKLDGSLDGYWSIVRLNSMGKYVRSVKLHDIGIDDDVVGFEAIHTSSKGDVYLSTSNENGSQSLFFIEDGRKKSQNLYTTSANSGEKIYAITEQNQICTFLVDADDEIRAYKIEDNNRAIFFEKFDKSELGSGDAIYYVFEDGREMMRKDGNLYFGGELFAELPEDSNIINVWEADKGAIFLDASTATLWARYPSNSDIRSFVDLLSVDEDITALDNNLKGDIVAVYDCKKLIRYYSNTYEDLTQNLTRPRYIAMVMIGIFELLLLFLTTVFWYMIAVTWRMHYSLIFRWGVVLLVGFYVLQKIWGIQLYNDVADELQAESFEYLNAINKCNPSKEEIRKVRGDFNVLEFKKDEDNNIYSEVDGKKKLIGMFYFGAQYVDNTREAFDKDGEITNTAYMRNGKRYYVSSVELPGDRVRSITVRERISSTDHIRNYRIYMFEVRLLMSFIWLSVILILLSFAARIISLSRRTRRIFSEKKGVNDFYGDEISELNDSMNSVGVEIREVMHDIEERRKCYERFMPKNVVELLGVKEVHEISKDTCSKNELILMTVSFKLNSELYRDEKGAVFSKLNNMVERSSKILDQHRGTVLDFRYDGFVALFRKANNETVVAAIKIVQEFQNEKDVNVHVILDSSMVMSGVIGNEVKMQPIVISKSYDISGKLLSFLDKAGAGILCTEEIYHFAKEYNCRYIGKILEDEEEIRVYEIYNGDLPETASKKESMEKIFLNALYSFYSGDYKTARGEFMQVVRENPNDEIAKYYLYEADSFENEGKRKNIYLD
ncbi:MAG: hypothetical protein K5894_09490 [Lachnospiraceae bacterium]|nr:hypothetical protein [Lachnospiraceae bacterium]